jgi:hypothetical protein
MTLAATTDGMRERIARTVDSDAWLTGGTALMDWEPWPSRRRKALAKADAIIEFFASQLSAKAAEIERLTKALEPFDKLYAESVKPLSMDFADCPRDPRPDDHVAWGFNSADITWGDFRRAAEALRLRGFPLDSSDRHGLP